MAVIAGWLRDHRSVALAAALAAALVLRAKDLVLGNPLGSSLVSLDASAFVVFVAVGAAVVALRSRVATLLLVRSPWQARLAWLAALVVATGVVVAISAGTTPSPPLLMCRIGVVLCLPLAVCAVWGEGAGLTVVFVLFASHLLSPRYGPVPWWSLLRSSEVGLARLTAAAAVVAALGWLYVGNMGGRRTL